MPNSQRRHWGDTCLKRHKIIIPRRVHLKLRKQIGQKKPFFTFSFPIKNPPSCFLLCNKLWTCSFDRRCWIPRGLRWTMRGALSNWVCLHVQCLYQLRQSRLVRRNDKVLLFGNQVDYSSAASVTWRHNPKARMWSCPAPSLMCVAFEEALKRGHFWAWGISMAQRAERGELKIVK